MNYLQRNKKISALPKVTGASAEGTTQESNTIKKKLLHTVQLSYSLLLNRPTYICA